MMKTLIFILLFAAQVEAQIPATVHVQWTPNPAAEAVVQYNVALDGGPPLVVLPAACTATLCSQTLTVPTFGLHTVTITASNLKLTTDPTSLQVGPLATITFTLGSVPTVVLGGRVVN